MSWRWSRVPHGQDSVLTVYVRGVGGSLGGQRPSPKSRSPPGAQRSFCRRRLAVDVRVRESSAVAAVDPDLALRQAAVARARQLAQLHDDLVPLAQLQAGFVFEDERVSFGSFQ